MGTLTEQGPNFNELMEGMKAQFADFARDIAEREWELMELNMFISSAGKERLDKASNSVRRLRQMEKEGKINLKQYEDLAEEF